jgi:hypothetical protein
MIIAPRIQALHCFGRQLANQPAALIPGNYDLTVQLQGFKTYQSTGIVLQVEVAPF